MEAENLLNLLDSHWYDLDFFHRSKPTKINKIPEIPFSNIDNNSDLKLAIIHTKSPTTLEKMSSNSKLSDFSASPNSVLLSSKLQTIFSGKQTEDFTPKGDSSSVSSKGNLVNSQTRLKKRLSKSLSDLEFEELKGFMDLGFVFSEHDKDSILASIIPGLHRLGNNNINNNNNNINNNDNDNDNDNDVVENDGKNGSKKGVTRPYLSEAWKVLEKKNKKKQNSVVMLNWKVGGSNNEIDMKCYLKSWAHSVASAVKSS
ncbi:hypothetical protein RND81_08G001500 [Saponaria officinalis]|uniref:Uncharacterized protein n=1 Tax=Saponaria officinalis TaxID=3572 RepID=A0AAW1J211_SAPOF